MFGIMNACIEKMTFAAEHLTERDKSRKGCRDKMQSCGLMIGDNVRSGWKQIYSLRFAAGCLIAELKRSL